MGGFQYGYNAKKSASKNWNGRFKSQKKGTVFIQYIPDLQASEYRDDLILQSKYNHVFKKKKLLYKGRDYFDAITAVFFFFK